MDIHQNLIYLFDKRDRTWKEQTANIVACDYASSNTCQILFALNGRKYTYSVQSIKWMSDPSALSIPDCHFFLIGRKTFIPQEKIKEALEFVYSGNKHWRIFFYEGVESKVYDQTELAVLKSCLIDYDAKDVFSYLKEISSVSVIRDDEQGLDISLRSKYDRLDFIPDDTAMASYLNPKRFPAWNKSTSAPCIFPFGCNGSQLKAVKAAFQNQFSIIQGPPGTGKTQTILNIIANILIQKKNVLVVSSNNSAIENIVEKLNSYGLDFIDAELGKSENIASFIENQTDKKIPEKILNWFERKPDFFEIDKTANALSRVFAVNERIAQIKVQLSQLKIEQDHFEEEFASFLKGDCFRKSLSSKVLTSILVSLQIHSSGSEGHFNRWKRWWFLNKCHFYYGLKKEHLSIDNLPSTLLEIKAAFYNAKAKELEEELQRLEEELKSLDGESLMKSLTSGSMSYLKASLHERYENGQRTIFTSKDIWRNGDAIAKEYPVILSTTFSARCLNDVVFDYVIMDEASQVSVETGALALSAGRNVVIVGDSQQLPNVQTQETKAILETIFAKFQVQEGYNSASYSFLDSVKQILKENCCVTLLKEHYRCHPQIINFCNQEFYGGELIIMSKGSEDNPLHVVRTVPGNHARGHENVREAEAICQEVMPKVDRFSTGIIAAYNHQVDLLAHMVGGDVKISTVHKFQGQEKDTIIIDFVDNQPTDFSDDPNLMNVAVSRAKKDLYLVVTGNEIPKGTHIADLIDYITYNNGEVVQSDIRSIFDALYADMDESFIKRLQSSGVESPAELLTYEMIKDILLGSQYSKLGIRLNYPVREILRDTSLLSEEEKAFVLKPWTHTDLLLFNRVSKQPVLAIETDGHTFHQADGAESQKVRDAMKDAIFAKYHIPLIRLGTTGSGERARVVEVLESIGK